MIVDIFKKNGSFVSPEPTFLGEHNAPLMVENMPSPSPHAEKNVRHAPGFCHLSYRQHVCDRAATGCRCGAAKKPEITRVQGTWGCGLHLVNGTMNGLSTPDYVG